MDSNTDKKLFNIVKKIVYKVLHAENLTQREWNHGEIESVIDSKFANVYVNGSNNTQKIPTNPDITFAAGDKVFVIFINRDPKDKFVISKRSV